MQTSAFEQPMRAALELAARGPEVDPNPRVGCVLERDGAIVGRGWHAGAGTPHAEVVALADAGELARGATAYVTLEPCAHTGRTGPCVDALTAAGVQRVVFAQADPNPLASGGAQVLRARGIEVYAGTLATEAEALNAAWTYAVIHEKPWVTWKFAASIDGRSAAADGTSQWLSNEQSRSEVHDLRRRSGAVLVGTGTALADNPSLTARDRRGATTGHQPLRVIVGEREIPTSAKVFDHSADTFQVRTHDPEVVLKELHDRGIHRVLLEGGATLGAAFCRAGLVDELLVYLAPRLLGGGTPAVGDLGIGTLADAPTWTLYDVARIADDVQLTYRRK